ncbi:MAG: hypothetical protein GKC06_01390 [Methanomicrobiales archaeon]|nr:hypothetical protein [Methanomicrobiales archaeon]
MDTLFKNESNHSAMASHCVLCATGSWKLPLVIGILAIIVGSLLLLFPSRSVEFILAIFGVIAFVIGLLLFWSAWTIRRAGSAAFAAPLILGILALVLALVAFFNPDLIRAFLAVIFAFFCIIGGLLMLAAAFSWWASAARRILMGGGGIILAAIGILILFSPYISAPLVMEMIGLFFLASGLVSVIGSLLLWRRSRTCVIREWEEYRQSGQ